MRLEWLLDILFPKFCLGCGIFGDYICEICQREKIHFYDIQFCPYCKRPSPYGLTHPRCQTTLCLDGMFVLAHYDGLIKDVIHRVKYQSEFAVLENLAKIIFQKYHYKFLFDYLVPVPLAPKREQERGFNQAEKLCECLIKQIKLIKPIKLEKLLIRNRETRPQFDLHISQRQKNVSNAFALNSRFPTTNLSNYSFCLVDDVATTGSTLFECAKVLKGAGAEKVYAIVIARD